MIYTEYIFTPSFHSFDDVDHRQWLHSSLFFAAFEYKEKELVQEKKTDLSKACLFCEPLNILMLRD